MPYYRDTRGYETLDGGEEMRSALELHCISSRLLHDMHCGGKGCLLTDLIAPKGHIDDDEGTPSTTHDTGAVVDHLIEGDGEGRGVPCHHIGGRVTDEEDIYTCCIQQTSHRIVVGGKHRDRLTLGLHSCQTKGRDLLRLRLVLRHFF